MEYKQCPKCNSEVPTEDCFCGKCGFNFGEKIEEINDNVSGLKKTYDQAEPKENKVPLISMLNIQTVRQYLINYKKVAIIAGIVLVIIILSVASINPIKSFIAERHYLLESEDMFKNGTDNFNSKNYQVALNDFENVIPSDKQNYQTAQVNIKKINTQLALTKLDEAKKQYNNGDYKDALSTLREAYSISGPTDELTSLMILYDNKVEQQEAQEAAVAEKQARQTEIADMKKLEYGSGLIGIAVVGVKASNTVDESDGMYRYLNEPDKDQFVWLDIAAYNIGSDISSVNPLDFTLSTDDGYTVNYDDATYDANYFNATNLSPDTYSSGWLIFVMPKADEYTLHFNSFNSMVDKKIIMNT